VQQEKAFVLTNRRIDINEIGPPFPQEVDREAFQSKLFLCLAQCRLLECLTKFRAPTWERPEGTPILSEMLEQQNTSFLVKKN
jgi:hypothetical protein